MFKVDFRTNFLEFKYKVNVDFLNDSIRMFENSSVEHNSRNYCLYMSSQTLKILADYMFEHFPAINDFYSDEDIELIKNRDDIQGVYCGYTIKFNDNLPFGEVEFKRE